MSTRLSAKMARMSIEELAHEYAMAGVNNRSHSGNSYGEFSLMAMTQYALREEMIRRTGEDRTNQAIASAREILKVVGL